eukprot:5227478-Alexandrium_andersonii.AAC.1
MPRRLTFAPTATMYLSISPWELFVGAGVASAGAWPWPSAISGRLASSPRASISGPSLMGWTAPFL